MIEALKPADSARERRFQSPRDIRGDRRRASALGPAATLDRLIDISTQRTSTGPCSMRSCSRPGMSWGCRWSCQARSQAFPNRPARSTKNDT